MTEPMLFLTQRRGERATETEPVPSCFHDFHIQIATAWSDVGFNAKGAKGAKDREGRKDETELALNFLTEAQRSQGGGAMSSVCSVAL